MVCAAEARQSSIRKRDRSWLSVSQGGHLLVSLWVSSLERFIDQAAAIRPPFVLDSSCARIMMASETMISNGFEFTVAHVKCLWSTRVTTSTPALMMSKSSDIWADTVLRDKRSRDSTISTDPGATLPVFTALKKRPRPPWARFLPRYAETPEVLSEPPMVGRQRGELAELTR